MKVISSIVKLFVPGILNLKELLSWKPKTNPANPTFAWLQGTEWVLLCANVHRTLLKKDNLYTNMVWETNCTKDQCMRNENGKSGLCRHI